MDFLTMDYTDTFDAVIQVYGELCVFFDAQRDDLLRRIHMALKQKWTVHFLCIYT
jgi:hypothetical protein